MLHVCLTAKQLLKRCYSSIWWTGESENLTASLVAHDPFPQPLSGADRPISLPQRVVGGIACPLMVPHALPCTWTGHCLASVFLLMSAAELIHQSWRLSFSSAFVLIAFCECLVQAHLYITLTEVGYFLPDAPVAGDGGEPGRRTGSGKGPCGAGRTPGSTVCWKEEKTAKTEGERKGNRVNLGWDEVEKAFGWGWFYMVLSEGWEDNLDGDRERPVGTDSFPSSFSNKEKKGSEDIPRGTGVGNNN